MNAGWSTESAIRSQTRSCEARTMTDSSTRMCLTRQGEAALGGQVVQRLLHHTRDMLVGPAPIGAASELLPQVDRRQYLRGDLRRQWEVAQEIADVQAPRQGERDRQDLQS